MHSFILRENFYLWKVVKETSCKLYLELIYRYLTKAEVCFLTINSLNENLEKCEIVSAWERKIGFVCLSLMLSAWDLSGVLSSLLTMWLIFELTTVAGNSSLRLFGHFITLYLNNKEEGVYIFLKEPSHKRSNNINVNFYLTFAQDHKHWLKIFILCSMNTKDNY